MNRRPIPRAAGDNQRWRDIERAYDRRHRLNPNQARFIEDMHTKGPSYNMTEKQHRYLSGIIHKLNRQAAGFT